MNDKRPESFGYLKEGGFSIDPATFRRVLYL